MRTLFYLLIVIAITIACIWSCGPKVTDNSKNSEYQVETITGENIELRNKLRKERHRTRNNRHRNRYQGIRNYFF
ncbi:hypothetical protein [uncultured Psychroserpens sp.]|uniref:hypothetical protein n=1 Tax=uncultured Psychroserpens sp. TaxID=255436 RepID=UPI0026043592|nr:hypothetical protein [uncultured Psychroserpens sp.]